MELIMKTPYNKYSPYFKTPQTSWYLDVLTPREIPARDQDKPYQIKEIYRNKPHLLAYDLYGDSRLWWVFSMRNKDVIKDPIYDFVVGLEIVVTSKEDLMSILNV